MARAFSRAGRTLAAEDLLERRLLCREGESRHPTTGGLLLFGRRRQQRFPDAWIQAARFQGGDRSVILDGAELRGDLPTAVEEAMAFALRNLTRSSAITGLRRADEFAVPPVALREALVNAVVHADYSQRGAPIRLAIHDDRVEITSPGLLPSGLTLSDLDHGVSRLRNRVLGRVFFALRLVEQWGSGVARMRRAMAEAGLPTPDLREVGLTFRVSLGTERTGEPLAEGKDEVILDLLAAEGALSTSAVAARVGLSDRATRTRLRNLVERGLVTEIGSGPNDPQRKYALLNRNR
jgi:predicted HTH transcriptional regulator